MSGRFDSAASHLEVVGYCYRDCCVVHPLTNKSCELVCDVVSFLGFESTTQLWRLTHPMVQCSLKIVTGHVAGSRHFCCEWLRSSFGGSGMAGTGELTELCAENTKVQHR